MHRQTTVFINTYMNYVAISLSHIQFIYKIKFLHFCRRHIGVVWNVAQCRLYFLISTVNKLNGVSLPHSVIRNNPKYDCEDSVYFTCNLTVPDDFSIRASNKELLDDDLCSSTCMLLIASCTFTSTLTFYAWLLAHSIYIIGSSYYFVSTWGVNACVHNIWSLSMFVF
jgi:hypothetical protein